MDSNNRYRHSLLRTFRISYAYIMPSWNETLKRMFVIASLPSITLLNRASIRRKERTDSELFYLQRGLAQQQQQQQGGEDAAQPQQPRYPLLPLLLEQYKDVVLSVYTEGSTASSAGATHIMLTVTLVVTNQFVATGSGAQQKGKPKATNAPFQVQKTLPSSLTIAQLKALVKATFQIDLMHQKLAYVNKGEAQSGAAEQPVELTQESQSLGYYGVSDGAVVHITDTSLR
ncbi:hypothetical protein STCU_04661 [Strigomonas culicis]|uniref:Ubiquitin-like domain-containing protein n=1 Tax=Strigomonas culicis TaxID=28005 RepID=S9UEJ3_9TRYP|nr:hypothetical protein STCU_04661 [Strigomonas culicis]|eukprot:EPY29227.1 hypothetical protein STCU_04661 [Strigomonas culicis]